MIEVESISLGRPYYDGQLGKLVTPCAGKGDWHMAQCPCAGEDDE